MLRLILGRSGFGKTHRVVEDIAALTQDNKQTPCLLLVPEQASFETERMLIRRLGERAAASVRVLSFTRLSETLLKHSTIRPLSNGAKMMLMSRAIGESVDSLSLFASSKGSDIVSALLDVSADCHRSAVTPQMLREAVTQLPEGVLRRKTEELALLMETYDTLSADCGTDPQETLLQLETHLREHRPLNGTQVFVDGFSGFTAPERRVLTALMEQADTLTVTLCTDRVDSDINSTDRFALVMETARSLTAAATQVGCTVDKHTLLITPHRFQNAALETLEATALTTEQFETDASNAVTMTACGDIYEESRYVAGTIRRLMREESYRAKDIAIVAGNLTDYIGVLDMALERADIPYYLDRRAPIISEGLVSAVLLALRVATGGWRTETLLQLMKTGLLGFSVSSASQLENYVFVWNITGSKFKTEWTAHPRGFAEALTPEDESKLCHLNRLRRRLVTPLEALSRALSRPLTGERFARAVYEYIHAARIDRVLKRHIMRLHRDGEPALAAHVTQVWDSLMDLLDDMADVLGDDKSVAADALELLRLAAANTNIGAIPQALDAVQIGAADRMRFVSPRAVFVLGANEGVFPAFPTVDGLFTHRDRMTLCALGVPFDDEREHQSELQQFLAYSALSAASDKLFVSFLRQLPGGERGEMSSICHAVLTKLPFVSVTSACAEDGRDIETVDEAFERMAGGFRAKTPLSRALYQLLWQDESLRGQLRKMTQIAQDLPIAFEDGAAAQRLFGNNMALSPSRVERFHQCRFSYYCQYGLDVQPLRAAELGTLEFGTLTHYVMENTLPTYINEGIATIQKARCFEDAATQSTCYVEEQMGGLADKSERFRYLLKRLQVVCGNFLWQAVRELSQSRFVPVDYELSITNDPHIKDAVCPLVFTLPDGTQVSMTGKIDRVDICDINGVNYVRVIDYKTGSKTFDIKDVVEGINLQMLMYLITLWKNGDTRYGSVLPAGLLYVSSKTPVIDMEQVKPDASLEQLQTKKMRMNGLLLNEEDVLRAMEPDGIGLFIPASFTQSGIHVKSSVASLATFGALARRAQDLLVDMAQSLHAGDIDALPFSSKNKTACQYCDYRAVCGHEEGDRVREARFNDSDEALASLQETEGTC